MSVEKRDDPNLELLKALPPPPTLPQTPLQAVSTLVLMPFFQGMFYGLGEGVARLLVFRWWGIENFTTIPTAGVTSQTASRMAEADQERATNGWNLFGSKAKTGSAKVGLGVHLSSEFVGMNGEVHSTRRKSAEEREGIYRGDVLVMERDSGWEEAVSHLSRQRL
ncbi:hypothetical protein HDU81_011000 [Chytriomyces hyalinus]|nr:hypothetical protein HDU81_011000 [Chytriomyces hyalinus]